MYRCMNEQQIKFIIITVGFLILAYIYNIIRDNSRSPILYGGQNLTTISSKETVPEKQSVVPEKVAAPEKVALSGTVNEVSPQVDNTERLIKGLKFSSNTGLDALSSEYSSRYAGLDSKGAWGGNPQLKYFTYLEVTLPDFYNVTGIVTAGNEDLREWVTEFYIEYWDNYEEVWNKYDKLFTGNNDDKTFIVNRIDINTTKIRVFPVNWQTYPSMRVGLMGRPAVFSDCAYYQSKIDKGEPGQKDYYTSLFNAKCLKVDIGLYKKIEEQLINKNEELVQMKRQLDSKERAITDLRSQLENMKQDYCPKQQLIDLATRYKDSLLHANKR